MKIDLRLFLTIVTGSFLLLTNIVLGDWSKTVIPKTGNTIEDFVPKNCEIIDKGETDFNGDSLIDVVIVIQEKDDPQKYSRPLLVLFKQSTGGYILSSRADHAVPEPGSGGVHSNDGFEGLEIRKDTFVIKHFGGSSVVNSDFSQFQYRKGSWFLIGKKSEYGGNLDQDVEGIELSAADYLDSYSIDTNFLTGEQEEKWSIFENETNKDHSVVKRKKIPIKPLVHLEEFY